ncbi:MAG: hypothetical protein DMG65_03905 [Candidatus Angelobacter sp. Gp1-AA117]|nr:MAG: hypothetical protein DMG65_03905 [Candidatus Angelobacter sp. Gp1-AA117]
MTVPEQSRIPGGLDMPLACLCAPEPLSSFGNAALVVAHPGHELRVFGWMSQWKPRVYVITDGSGRHGVSRVPSTSRILDRLNIPSGEIFGCINDTGIYQAIRQQDFSFFLSVTDRLASALIKHRISFVAGDATEGYNTSHDLCRVIVNAAVQIASCASAVPIANYEFCLTEWDQTGSAVHDDRCLHFRLNDQLLSHKLEAAQQYAELKEEVSAGIAHRGAEYFRLECLRKVNWDRERILSEKPFYETWGERRVSSGAYPSVIRYREHILPLTAAIMDHAARISARRPAAAAVR